MTESLLITIIDDFLTDLKRQGLQVTTITNRRQSLDRFISFLAGTTVNRLQDVTVQVLEDYRGWLARGKASTNTIETYLRAVRRLFDYLETEQLVFENPTRMMALHRSSKRLPTILTVNDVQKLLSVPDLTTSLGIRNRAILEVSYSTGIRCEELLNLSVFDVECDRRTIRVLGKGRKERNVPMGCHAADYVKRYVKDV